MEERRHEAVELFQKQFKHPDKAPDLFDYHLERFIGRLGQPLELVFEPAQVKSLQDKLVLKMLGLDQRFRRSGAGNDFLQAALAGGDFLFIEFEFFDPAYSWRGS